MLSQDDIPHSHALAKDQTRPGILTPTPDNSLNLSDGTGPGGKKRKRDGNTMEDLLKDSFVVRPYPSNVPVKPRTLQPLVLLPRSQLPLSSLDIISSSNVLPQTRLFEAHVKILELEERMGSQPMVLIARLDDGRTLYAIEREDRGLYVLCKLGSWVNLQPLRAVAAVSRQELPKSLEKGFGVGEMPQNVTPAPTTISECTKFSKKKRLAIEAIQSMVKRPSSGFLTDSQSNTSVEPEKTKEPKHTNATQKEPIAQIHDMDDATIQPTAAEIFENVRTQYFDALYLSKASLAYFAKGPLSRARAAFHLDYDSTLDMNDHIAFLESLIMSTTLIEKKYRDGLPSCVSLIDIQDHSVDDAATAKAKKRRSSKKIKPGKNGLYPAEDDLIRRWWATHDDDAESGAPGVTREDLAKSRITQLRIRETQLQMILILEVLALQPLASATEDVGGGLPGALPTSSVGDGKEKLAKGKKPDHLTMLIDVHIDRLCIWQSIALESMKAPTGVSQNMTESAPKHSDNVLRDFCIEVIAPFFSARLPDRCAVINRKLGGPVTISPPRPRLPKSASFSGPPAKPGAATKRPVPAKPRRSLKRVLTDDRERRSMSTGPNRAISLMRSATMPMVPGLKREASEAPSLSSIPTSDSQPFAANRGGVLNSKRFAQREVDLSNIAPESNVKARKQAKIEAELKEAIAALKKPNRELAGKVLVETAERRSVSATHPRKSKKPVRNPLFQGVQISATPKANRQIDMFVKSQPSELPRTTEEMDLGAIPPSSLPRIPQSSKQSQEKKLIKNPFFSSVQATPTRRPATSQPTSGLLGPPIDYGEFPPSSPLHVRRSSASLFPIVPESTLKAPSGFEMPSGVQETPIKKRPDPQLKHSHPGIPASGSDKENTRVRKEVVTNIQLVPGISQRQEDSIYKSLGWDDADDMDELA